MEPSIFTRIIEGEIPAHFLYEDEVCVAILDAFPAIEGQTLIIPRTQVDYFADLDDTTYQHLFRVTKQITHALDTALQTARTCLVVEGFEVPHVHVKLYPFTRIDTPLGEILPQGTKADDASLAAIAEKIRTAL